MVSRSPYALSLIALLSGRPPHFYVVALAVASVALLVVAIGHAILGLLRDLRDYRRGD
jgi:hypothetical protein